jgi:ATP-dependent Clp protease ATP-binding subunit ClpC
VPRALQGCRVVALDLGGMVAGTKYRGEFEQRMRRVIDEVTAADRGIVLFLDEFHTLVGAGAGVEGGAMDAADILKPALARGDLQVLGATTMEEYRKHVESDAALERRFAPVTVAEPTVEQTVAILDGLRARYEDHHDVRLPADARRAAVELTARHVRDRFLPDKAIDALDTVAARVRLRHDDTAGEERRAEAGRRVERLTREQAAAIGAEDYERADALRRELEDARSERDRAEHDRAERDRAARPAAGSRPVVTVADVAAVVADISGVPVAHLGDDDRDRLLGLADRLRARVVGQDEAVETVADAVLAGRAGMSHPGRPVASLLFAGPTGVGKTELARALAAGLFGDEERMVRFDLGEFREAHTVNRLVGAPPGYAGHDRSGELTEAVRRTPYCVVLLDEIEKAHVDVQSLLLGVLDAGRLTDGRGRTVSFADTVIIMTTNLGAAALTAGRDPEDAREEVTTALAKALRPEFLGRVDEVVLFGALDDATLRRIVGLQLDATRERLAAQDLTATVTEAAVDALVARGRDPRYGARPLRRAVQREVDRPLARRIVSGALRPGGHVVVDARDDGTLTFG